MEYDENIIDNILHRGQEDSDKEYHFKNSFIESIKSREKQKSIEIKNLNQLFKVSIDMIIKK